MDGAAGAAPTTDWLSDFFDTFDADDVGAFDVANAFADVPTEVIGGEGASERERRGRSERRRRRPTGVRMKASR